MTRAQAKKRLLAFEKGTYTTLHADWWHQGFRGRDTLPDEERRVDDALQVIHGYLRRTASEGEA
jgi:hypothetical protein